MQYRLFIYKTTAVTADAPAIGICNRAVSTRSLREWDENDAARHMLPFHGQELSEQLRTLLGETCRIHREISPPRYGDAEYLCVTTSYDQAASVLPRIHCVTAEHDLVLYDAERRKTFYRDLVDRTFLCVKSRIAQCTHRILTEMKPIWRIRKIGVSVTARDHDYTYVVTLRKDAEKTFLRRCSEFLLCLQNLLREDETLRTDHECFTVVGRWYTITFCLEGYKKHPDRMGYCLGGVPKEKLIRRMGCEEGFRWLKEHGENPGPTLRRMNFTELRKAYPNPADRFAASVRITKWECGQSVFRFCGLGLYGSEILFHAVPTAFCEEEDRISVLAVDEDCAAPLLSVVNRFYPYFGSRYYMEENHLPLEMWREITEAARVQRQEYLDNGSRSDANLLDVFIRWSEAQLDCYDFCGDGRMFNLQGP